MIFFVQFFCVFLPPLLNISASIRAIPFLSFIEPILTWNVPLVSRIFLKRSLVFPILLFSFIPLHWPLRKAFLSLLAVLWNSAFKWVYFCFLLLFSELFVRPPQITIFTSCISFSLGWSWSLPPVQCQKPLSIVLQALCLSDLVPWIYFLLPLYIHKRFDLGHTWMV